MRVCGEMKNAAFDLLFFPLMGKKLGVAFGL
jgi:hypothetical protein